MQSIFVSLNMFSVTETRDFYGFFVKSLSVSLYRFLRLLTNSEKAIGARIISCYTTKCCRNFYPSSLKLEMDRRANEASQYKAESRK